MDMTILTANERQALLTATDWEIQDYIRRREKYEFDKTSMLNNAERKGELKGERKTSLKIARKLLAKGSTPEFVHEITGFDMDTLKNLQAGSPL